MQVINLLIFIEPKKFIDFDITNIEHYFPPLNGNNYLNQTIYSYTYVHIMRQMTVIIFAVLPYTLTLFLKSDNLKRKM